MTDEQSLTRRITVELPPDVTMSDEELESLAAEFKSQVIDTKAEQMVVQAKPKEKSKETPVAVIGKEVAVEVPKQKAQMI